MSNFFDKTKATILIVSLGLLIAGVFAWRSDYVRTLINNTPLSSITKPQEVPVTKLRVINGSEFDLTLESGIMVHGHLAVKTPVEATKKVIELINRSESPRIVPKEKRDQEWVVDLLLMVDGYNLSLTDWLKTNNLAYSEEIE